MDVAKDKVQKVDERTLTIELTDAPGGSLAYIWRESPVKELYKLPIYSADDFRMPTPPFKHQLD